MNNPIIEGAVFRNDWIRWGKRPAWSKFSELVLYIDPSFKGSTKNDFKAAKLWGKAGTSSGVSALLSVSAPWLKWSAGVTTSTTGRARKILPCAGIWKPISCRTLSSTSSDVRANCAAISYPLPATSAESPTSSSAWKRSAPVGARLRHLRRDAARRPRHARRHRSDPCL